MATDHPCYASLILRSRAAGAQTLTSADDAFTDAKFADDVFAAAVRDLEQGFFAPMIEHIGDDCVWQDRRSLWRLRDRRRCCQGIDMVRETLAVSLGAFADAEGSPSVDVVSQSDRALSIVVRGDSGAPMLRVLCALEGSTIVQITTTPSRSFAALKGAALQRGIRWFP